MKKGFTLIELLIVVAIIAILAAIAVPNFIEAQVRAKVARAQTDMRTLRTVMESYNIDNNTYPYSVCPDYEIFKQPGASVGSGTRPETTWPWYSGITTPISYIGSIPLDPFSVINTKAYGGGEGPNPYHYYSGNGKVYQANNAYMYARRIFFILASLGPDIDLDLVIDTTHFDAYVFYMRKDTNGGGNSGHGVYYDATNGSKSSGDIYMFNADDLVTKNNANWSGY